MKFIYRVVGKFCCELFKIKLETGMQRSSIPFLCKLTYFIMYFIALHELYSVQKLFGGSGCGSSVLKVDANLVNITADDHWLIRPRQRGQQDMHMYQKLSLFFQFEPI